MLGATTRAQRAPTFIMVTLVSRAYWAVPMVAKMKKRYDFSKSVRNPYLNKAN
jgi:hypothetical protein